MPNGTKVQCCHCGSLATSQHILLHAHPEEECHAGNFFQGETPSIRELIRAFANRKRESMVYICRRIVLYLDDYLADKWANRLLTYLEK